MNNSIESIFPSPDVYHTFLQLSGGSNQIYLVGGAVRDLLMHRKGRDLDFVAAGDVLRLSRQIADAIGAAYYVMDVEHQIARVIYHADNGQRWFLDFSALRGDTIQQDLKQRDFTVNAIAIRLDKMDQLIDPLSGARAINQHQLEMCSPGAFTNDPLRVMRAVRLSADLGFKITPETLRSLKSAIPELSRVSVERQRDELFHILESRQASVGLRTGFALGIFQSLLPEVAALRGEVQAAPHIYDIFDHTLACVEELLSLYDLLVEPFVEGKGANLIHGMTLLELGRYRENLAKHFSVRLNPDRSLLGLLMLTGLLHDIAKPATRSYDEDGRLHFYDHDRLGGQTAENRGRELALSTDEVERLALLVGSHMRIHFLAKNSREVSRRSMYRYFRDLGEAGIDLVLLSLADKLATYGVTITPAEWQKELEICRQLLEAWFVHKDTYLMPVKLISGSDLIGELQLQAGPLVGQVLEAVREAQATGQIATKEEALQFSREWLKTNS